MTREFLIGGVILSPLLPQLLLALLLTALLSLAFIRLGVYRFVWHRPLVELSIFCILLGLIVALPSCTVRSPDAAGRAEMPS